MENVCKQVIKQLIKLSNIASTNEDEEVYVYGLISYIYTLIPGLCLLFISFIFQKPIEIIVWMCVFLSLRKYAGGLHATTPFSCFFCSVLLGISSHFLYTYINVIPNNIYLICIIANLLFLIYLAPTTNKEFSTKVILRCKLVITFLLVFYSILFYIFSNIRCYYLHALFSTTILCIAHKIQK